MGGSLRFALNPGSPKQLWPPISEFAIWLASERVARNASYAAARRGSTTQTGLATKNGKRASDIHRASSCLLSHTRENLTPSSGACLVARVAEDSRSCLNMMPAD